MELQTTLAIMAVAAVLAVVFGWRGSRPWMVIGGPRMAPWALLMLLCATLAIFMALHVLTLLGFTPGRH